MFASAAACFTPRHHAVLQASIAILVASSIAEGQPTPNVIIPSEPAVQFTAPVPVGSNVSQIQDPSADPSRLERLPAVREGYSIDDDAPSSQAGSGSDAFPDGLSIADVIASLYQCYPEIQQAREEFRRTDGELWSSWGAYDTKLEAYSLNEPTGFYENHRHAIGVARRTWWGGYLSAGYRVGRGDFQPWYKERETDQSGEFKLGWVQPLLRGKAVDLNRVAVFQASLARQASQPVLQQAILDSAREATETYWKWVAAGTVLRAQRELLQLAEVRGEKLEFGASRGASREVDVVFNKQLIAERQVKVLDSERKFQAAAFKLSLFLRDPACQPIIPTEDWLPNRFPVTERPTGGDLATDLAESMNRRPEPQVLQFEIQRVRWEQQLSRNDMLPSLDFVAEASQDLGVPASSSDDKGEFLLIVGVQGEVPIQRRKARGKFQSTSAKIAQLRQKLFLQQNKIAAELRTAYNALQLNAQIVEQAEEALRQAIDVLERYRVGFENSYTDLIYINLLETKVNETEVKLIEAQGGWFLSLGQLQAALGLDPLEQSLRVSELPLSERPGPGRLPQSEAFDEDKLLKEFEAFEQQRANQQE